jgi:PilZ domain
MRIERRSATRYNFGAIAEIIDLGPRVAMIGVTRDLSVSGCFVKTTAPFAKGTEVIVRIRHSGTDFAAIGEVTGNVTPEGMGIAFVQIQPTYRAIVEEWLGYKSASGAPGIPVLVSREVATEPPRAGR